jgi:hypothetical protein
LLAAVSFERHSAYPLSFDDMHSIPRNVRSCLILWGF